MRDIRRAAVAAARSATCTCTCGRRSHVKHTQPMIVAETGAVSVLALLLLLHPCLL